MAHTEKLTKQQLVHNENSFFRTMGHALKNYRLGDLLVVKGVISTEQLAQALIEQKRTKERLGKVLVRQGYLSAFQLSRKLTEQWCLRVSAVAVTFMLQAVNPTVAHAEEALKPVTVSAPIRLASAASAPHIATLRLTPPQQAFNAQTVDRESLPAPEVKTQSFHFNNIAPLTAPVNASAQAPAKGTLFGKKETKYSDMKEFKKWSSLFNRFAAKLETAKPETPGIAAWQSEVEKMKSLSPTEKVEYVNSFINQRPYVDDKKVFGNEGYWAANPARFFGQGGDCKDYAITKYATLRALGFSHDQMRVAVVQDKIKRIAHAVLIVEVEGKTLVLDNQEKTVKPAANVNRYKPIFAINSNNWWKQES